MANWKEFGLHLGVEPHVLEIIDNECRGKVAKCKIKLYQYWLDNDSTPSWEKVAQALKNINKGVLADEILQHSVEGK